MIKPDAVERRLAGVVLSRLEELGLETVAMKMLTMSRELAQRHYDVHRGKPFFEGVVDFITSGPVIALILEGPGAVEAVRRAMGATDPGKADQGTIRGDYGSDIERNLVHGSDSAENAIKEMALFFSPEEIAGYQRRPVSQA